MDEGAGGDADVVDDAEGAEDFGGGFCAGEQAGIMGEEFLGLTWGFAEELDAEIADAGGEHVGDELGGGLGLGVEEGVAAADVGEEGVAFAGAVEEIHGMFFTGAAAGAEIGAVRESVGEDAVFHMEHWHVLMDDAFKAGGIEAGEEGGKLGPIQVVAGNHAEEAMVGEEMGGEFVGDVEGVVADEGISGAASWKKRERGVGADQDRVGAAVGDLLEEAVLAGLDDAEGGEGDWNVGGAALCDGVGVAADVFVFDINGGGAGIGGEGGGELIGGADEDVHCWGGDAIGGCLHMGHAYRGC